MTKQVEVITSIQRRRRWTAAEKERLVTACLEPGAVISAITRQAGVHPSQLYGWRRQLCAPGPDSLEPGGSDNGTDQAGTFAAVRLVSEPAPATVPRSIAATSGARSRSSSRPGRGCGSPARWMRRRFRWRLQR